MEFFFLQIQTFAHGLAQQNHLRGSLCLSYRRQMLPRQSEVIGIRLYQYTFAGKQLKSINMKTEKLEKQTLTWLVFSANVIVGAMARQTVLHHGLDAFNGYVAFGVCILMLTVIYINLQELFKKTLSPFFETLFMKFPNYGKKRKVETEDSKETTEEEPLHKETDTNPPPSIDYAQIRLSAMKAKEQAEQEKLATVLTYTRESFAPYMKEDSDLHTRIFRTLYERRGLEHSLRIHLPIPC